MELWEGLILVGGLLLCGIGQAWLLWDIDKQINDYQNQMKEIMDERCPDLEEEEREE